MNRRDFFKLVGTTVGGATLITLLPELPTIQEPSAGMVSGQFTAEFDKYMSANWSKPDMIFCTQETYNELVADYPNLAGIKHTEEWL